MSYANNHRFSIGGLAIASVIALAVNGSMLLGFNQLAQLSDTDAVSASGMTQLAATRTQVRQVTLEPVVISARRT